MAKKAEAKLATETQRRRDGKQKSNGGRPQDLRASAPLWQKPSALLDTRVVYCGDNLEQLAMLPDSANGQLARQKRVPKLAATAS